MRYYGIVVSSWADSFMLRTVSREAGHKVSEHHRLFTTEEAAGNFWKRFVEDKFLEYVDLEWNLEYLADGKSPRLIATKRRDSGLETRLWTYTVLPVPEDMSENLKIGRADS